MEISNIVLLVIIVAIAIYILSKLGKFIMQIVGVALVILVIWMLYSGGNLKSILRPGLETVLKDQDIYALHGKYCTEEKQEKAICNCIVQPIFDDLNRRHSNNQLRSIRANAENLKEETLKSLTNVESGIDQCLSQLGEERLKIVETITSYLEQLKKLAPGSEEAIEK